MHLHWIDWSIVAFYFAVSIGIGLWYARRGSASTEEYFVSGRKLGWFVMGTALVATTFAADTPLAITSWFRKDGLWRNWYWWGGTAGGTGMLGVFFFSRFWRRARVLTDNELIELRYEGRSAAFLRGFKAFYFAAIYNLIVMGWVIKGMSAVLTVLVDEPTFAVGPWDFDTQWTMIWGCVLVVLLYSSFSGLWGAVMTDVFQFFWAMAGTIWLAVVVVHQFGGMEGLVTQAQEAVRVNPDYAAVYHASKFSFLPAWAENTSFLVQPAFFVLFSVGVIWWSGHNADGGGYIIQRMLAAKDERHALLGTLYFNVMNYAVRMWPWVIVAFASVVWFPNLNGQPEHVKALGPMAYYPLVMKKVLGVGGMGFLVSAFLAAFMSTIVTQANWAGSYIVNDLYRRFLVRGATDRHYLWVSRIAVAAVMVLAALLADRIQSLERAWQIIYLMGCGVGLVLILRWFWWRVSAVSELTALSTSLVLTAALEWITWRQMGPAYRLFEGGPTFFGFTFSQLEHKALLIIPPSLVAWIVATMLSRPVSTEKLAVFYRRVRPFGFWGPVRAACPDVRPVGRWSVAIGSWLASIVFVLGSTIGLGKLCLTDYREGFACLAFAAAAGAIVFRNLAREGWKLEEVGLDELKRPAP